ncbi:MAG: hypothetical protein AB8F78_03760 [Saprospiraceae bacterium]
MAEFLRVQLSLKRADPSIIRVLEVPADYSAYELHLALQVSLGWNDREPFEMVRSKLTVGVEPSYAGAGIVHDGHAYRHADELEASDLFQFVGQQVAYTYDFSRLWEFDLKLIARVDQEGELPICTLIKEAAPIEDADDLDTYYGILIAYSDLDSVLHDLAVQLLGDDFDFNGPSPEEVTEHLGLLFSDEVEPHGTGQDGDDADFGWWDPSKYDDKMRLQVLQDDISRQLPPDLGSLETGEKQQALLDILRGKQSD